MLTIDHEQGKIPASINTKAFSIGVNILDIGILTGAIHVIDPIARHDAISINPDYSINHIHFDHEEKGYTGNILHPIDFAYGNNCLEPLRDLILGKIVLPKTVPARLYMQDGKGGAIFDTTSQEFQTCVNTFYDTLALIAKRI